MRPFSPIATRHIHPCPILPSRDGVSARQRRRGCPHSSRRLLSRSVAREWFTIRRHSTMTSESQTSRSTKLQNCRTQRTLLNYLQCARTTEQARSSRSTRSVLRDAPSSTTRIRSRIRGRDPSPGIARRIVKVRGWPANECGAVTAIARPHRWSRGDSNPGPPPCKGGALPAKLRPRAQAPLTLPLSRVGAPGLEPGTSALSGPRSDHLSYAPKPHAGHSFQHLTVPSSAQDGARDP